MASVETLSSMIEEMHRQGQVSRYYMLYARAIRDQLADETPVAVPVSLEGHLKLAQMGLEVAAHHFVEAQAALGPQTDSGVDQVASVGTISTYLPNQNNPAVPAPITIPAPTAINADVDQTATILSPITVAVPSPTVTVAGTAAPTWTGVTPGLQRSPTITIDEDDYPNSTGVSFYLNDVLNRTDATGPNDGSVYEFYPPVDLEAGDVVKATWTDESAGEHESTHTVTGVGPPDPDPDPDPNPGDDPDPPTDITHGQQLTASLVGIAGAANYGFYTSSLTQTGSFSSSADGQVIEGYDVNGSILINHRNVTVRFCRVRGGTIGQGSLQYDSQRNLRVLWCDFEDELSYQSLTGDGQTYMYRCHVTGCSRGTALQVGTSRIIECRMEDFIDPGTLADPHTSYVGDAGQGVDDLTVLRSWFGGTPPRGLSAPVLSYNTADRDNPNGSFQVHDCYIGEALTFALRIYGPNSSATGNVFLTASGWNYILSGDGPNLANNSTTAGNPI